MKRVIWMIFAFSYFAFSFQNITKEQIKDDFVHISRIILQAKDLNADSTKKDIEILRAKLSIYNKNDLLTIKLRTDTLMLFLKSLDEDFNNSFNKFHEKSLLNSDKKLSKFEIFISQKTKDLGEIIGQYTNSSEDFKSIYTAFSSVETAFNQIIQLKDITLYDLLVIKKSIDERKVKSKEIRNMLFERIFLDL